MSRQVNAFMLDMTHFAKTTDVDLKYNKYLYLLYSKSITRAPIGRDAVRTFPYGPRETCSLQIQCISGSNIITSAI